MLGEPKKIAAAVLLLLTLVLGACGDGEDRPDNAGDAGSGSASASHAHETTAETFPPVEAETTVDVVMKDFEFVMPTPIKAGKILFKIENEGPTEHEFLILKGSKELIGTGPLQPGKSGELAVVLEPGRYTASCHIGSGGARHDKLGMVQNFTVE